MSSLACEELAEVEHVVNEANRLRRGLFPDDRLGPGSYVQTHSQDRVMTLTVESQLAAVLTLSVHLDALKISLLAVAPAFQGGGLGEALIYDAERLARTEGLAWLRLDAVDHGRLVPYYKRLGFEELRRIAFPAGRWGATDAFEVVSLQRSVHP